MLNQNSKTYALVDCNNFYVSCERVFRPELRDKPVVVLSNNDGIIVARSNEIKAMKIPMGAPVFKYKEQLKNAGAYIFSSNYELYADMSRRVMDVLLDFTPDLEIYSIDEAFLTVHDLPILGYEEFGFNIKAKIKAWTGIPVSVGMGPTKTLAKAANELAKKHKRFNGVLNFADSSEEFINVCLNLLMVEDIWGVGRQYSKLLNAQGIFTALQFKQAPHEFIHDKMTVCGSRTQLELKGISCSALKQAPLAKQGIMNSRSFGNMITDFAGLREAVAAHTSRGVEKLRLQGSQALRVDVFITTNRFREHDKQYFASGHRLLLQASDYAPDFIQASEAVLRGIYRAGYSYKKAGVYISKLTSNKLVQKSLFELDAGLTANPAATSNAVTTVSTVNTVSAVSAGKRVLINKAIDKVHHTLGHSLLNYAVATGKKWQTKRGLCSPRYTTDWNDLLQV